MNSLTVFRIIMAFAIGLGTVAVWQNEEPHSAAQTPMEMQQPAG